MQIETEKQSSERGIVLMDPETKMLMKSKVEKRGNELMEWEKYKENVRPLKRGRNVDMLNDALKSHSHIHLKKDLLLTRRKLIEAIDEYKGDDPLQPWLRCIKWVQEAFPSGGDSSGLVLIYEQCVRSFWHDERYKNDLRYLKVWLEYAENCADAEVIYSFLDANSIGQTYSAFYIAYALHMEQKHKIKTADEIFNRGLSKYAQPPEKLQGAYRKFLARSMRRPKAVTDEESRENAQTNRSFGTVLSKGQTRTSDNARKNIRADGSQRIPLSIYKDANNQVGPSHPLNSPKMDPRPWDSLAPQKDRDKENTAIPVKWSRFKIPQKPVRRSGTPATTTSIEVFVDEQCSESFQAGAEAQNSSNLQLKDNDEREFKRETELLRENPLRNFPMNSLPR